MTDCPDTFAELDELWAGTWAPTEPSPTIHPSRMLPRIIRVIGSPWEAHEHDDGTWSFLAHGETIWGPMTGTVDDAFKLLLQVHRDPSPRAETQGRPVPDCDPLAPARGICLALLISAPIWFAGAYIVGRLTGWWL